MTGMIGGVNLNTLKNLYIATPPMNRQSQIADILELKNKQIDQLISNQQQQIEKLKEYKQSLISEVVARGLDPNVKMVDTGIEWIGKVKYDYEIKPISTLFEIKKK